MSSEAKLSAGRHQEPWLYTAELVHIVDGDTVDLRVMRNVRVDFGFRMDMGMQLSAVMRFRLSGIDTPELVGATRALGQQAAAVLREFLTRSKPIHVESLGEPDKYGGRWDARLRVKTAASAELIDVAEALVLGGYARRYTGSGPRPVWDPRAPYPLSDPEAW